VHAASILKEYSMGFDQQGSTVFCVTQGQSGLWDVSEQGFEKPLASFDSADDAKQYADDLAKNKPGASVQFTD
jgi:hypothetical protein